MRIDVKENDYYIEIGKNIDKDLRDYLAGFEGARFLVISDEKVYGIYKERLDRILFGLDYETFIVPEGEESKSCGNYLGISKFLIENNFTRTDKIIAFGGGVVGDLASFAASTYLRGVDLISVPTSLLAMVDSSVGGKNGINMAGCKNQLGTFYFPKMVHIDICFLETLDDRNIRNGLAEIYKAGVLADKDLFNYLTQTQVLDYEYIIKRAIEIKLSFVEGDERDKGKRQKLNLGHTLGHALEPISNFALNHGESVAIGMVYMARISERLGLGRSGLTFELESALRKQGLPCYFDFSIDEIMKKMKHDKKMNGGKILIILPVDIGVVTTKEVSLEDLRVLIELVM